jgi:hypothetical protein
MEERKREFERIEFEGKPYQVEVQPQQRPSLKIRLLKAIQEHPDGLNKTQVYLHAGCYPAEGSFALSKLKAEGHISFEQRSSFGNPIICRLGESSDA